MGRKHEVLYRRKGQEDCSLQAVLDRQEGRTKSLPRKNAQINLNQTHDPIRSFLRFRFRGRPTNKLIISLKTHYKECIEKKVAEVLKKFDDWWIIWEPKLIEHYCCGFKCKVKFVTPQLHLNFEWRFCPASLRSCVFYC